MPESLSTWAVNTPVILDGHPFTFVNHEYLKDIYDDDHHHIVIIKAAQVGCTVYGILRVFFNARYRNLDAGIFFPNRSDSLDFSKSRVNQLIIDNPETIGKWLRDTDSAGLKKVWNAFLYLRGMNSRVGIKSVPLDFEIFEEIDEYDNLSNIDIALERMSHSVHKEVLMLSNPTLPSWGIDREFQQTDQRYWLIKCSTCGEWNDMVGSFPDSLVHYKGKVIRACTLCHTELNPANGEWIAKKPGVTEKRGYHISQLYSHYVSPESILNKFHTTNNLQDFYNLKIGVAYVEAENRLSVQEVLTLCGNEGIASQNKGPSFMGVDQGKDLHVAISRKDWGREKVIHIGIYKDWEELSDLMKRFKVSRCVVDGMPEIRNARAFANNHKGKVFLNFYNEHQKGHYKWDERNLMVSCNRTESLDASHRMILDQKISFPKECKIVREFAEHLHNTAKKLEEDQVTGSKRYKYVKLGPDHFRHAFNYCAISSSYGAGGFFDDITF